MTAHENSYSDLGDACGETDCGEGCPEEGGNIFRLNGYQVASLVTGTIQAECDFWDQLKFFGNVDYEPKLDQAPSLSSVVEERPTALPDQYGLSQNFPNPFNPATTIRYQIPPPGGLVEIVVYDVAGREVATLLQEYKVPGYFDLTWSGVNARGQGVASGVYFMRMKAPGFVETRKIIFVK